MTQHRRLAIASIVAAVLIAYAGSFSGVFVLDDLSSIVTNPTVKHFHLFAPVDWVRALTPLRGEGLTVDGRPVLNFSLALNAAVGGTAVAGYHVVNLAIHLLAALLGFGMVRRLTQNLGLAWAAALLWAVHPLDTAAVTYVVQRAESLAGLFYLAAVYGLVWSTTAAQSGQNREAGSKVALRLSVLCCFLGMATKEMMVSAPLTILLLDRLYLAGSFRAAWRARRGYYLSLASSWLLLAVLVWHTGNRGATSGFGSGISAAQYWLTQPGAIMRYLELALWPYPQIFDYGAAWVSNPASVILPGLAVLGLGIGAILGIVRNRPWGLLGWVFFAVLAPTSLVPGNRQTLAEHRMYLPLLALIVALAGMLFERIAAIGTRKRFAPLPIVLVSILAAGLVFLTYRRNRDYRSALALYARDVIRQPANPYAQTNYGTALLLAKQYSAARDHLEDALRLKPDIQETEDNLGNALFYLGLYPESIAHYRRALALRPWNAEAASNLAEPYLKLEMTADARRTVEAALRLKSNLPSAHDNLGLVLVQEGRIPEAVNELQTAAELEPDNPEFWINYGNALRAARQPAAAMEAFERARRLDPTNAAIFFNWGGAAADLRQYVQAEALLRQAIALDGENPGAHQNLGNALLADNQPEAAVAEYRIAAGLAPQNAVVHYNLGNGLLRLNRREEAAREFESALRLNPQLKPAKDLLRALGRAN